MKQSLRSFPKDVLGYVYNPSMNLFHVIVILDNQPGALKDVAERIAATKLNILQGFHSAGSGKPQGAWSFFAETKDMKVTEKQISKAIESSKYVLSHEVRKGESGFLIDDFHFPVRIAPDQEAILISPSAVNAMFENIVEKFGSGGESIVYGSGVQVGRIGSQIAMKALGDAMISLGPRVIKIMNTSGVGQAELVEFSLDPIRIKVSVTNCFECSKNKGERGCNYVRGVIAGGAMETLGSEVTCAEVKCAGSGAEVCEFEIRPVEGGESDTGISLHPHPSARVPSR